MKSGYLSHSLNITDRILDIHLVYTPTIIDIIISTIKFMNLIAQDLIFRLDIQKMGKNVCFILL